MAKYTVTHTCGCEEIVQLVGQHSRRESKIEWLESKPCYACERKSATEQATAENAAAALPELQGSEKQIAWAETIRARMVREIRAAAAGIPELLTRETSEDVRREITDGTHLLVSEIEEQTSAHWFIENRERMYSVHAHTPGAPAADVGGAHYLVKTMMERNLLPAAVRKMEARKAAKAAAAACQLVAGSESK